MEELNIPYTLKVLPFPPRMLAREYLQINPLGTVPAFFDDDVKMTESAAICQYLATRDGPTALSVAPGDPEYGSFLNFLHFGEATLTFPQTLVLRYGQFEPPARRQPQVEEDYRNWFLARLKGINAVFAQRPYVCGERFTVADISVGYALMLASFLHLTERFSPEAKDYWTRLQSRDGFKRALAAQSKAAESQGIADALASL